MKPSWEPVILGTVIKRSQGRLRLQPDQLYREVTVRLWGLGVVPRRQVSGAEIAADCRFEVRHGQFIMSRIDARNGAMGIVPEELDGAVVSTDFPAFDVDQSRLLPSFLGWLSKTREFVGLCRQASEGTTNRVRLKERRFLNLSLPLPPIPEQQRIVARIEELTARVEEARGLRRQVSQVAPGLLLSESHKVFMELGREHQSTAFGSFKPLVTSGPRYWAVRYSDDGLRFYRAQDVGPDGRVQNGSKVFVDPPNTGHGHLALLGSGDLLLVITGATVGRVAVFTEDLEPGYVNQHVALCRLPFDTVDPRFALWGLRSPQGQAQLLGQRYGQGKPGLNLSNIRSLSLPFPPLPDQRRIVAYLDGLQAKVDALKRLQAETAAELDALLPSILDKAFKGER